MAFWRVPFTLRGLPGRRTVFRQRSFPGISGRVSVSCQETDFRNCDERLHSLSYCCSQMSTWSHSPIFFRNGLYQFRMYSAQGDGRQDKDPQSKCAKQEASLDSSDTEAFKKLSLYEKFKAMYTNYWYVLVPVHLSSSVVFLGVFYYAVSSGVDIVSILEKLNFSESIIRPIRDSSAGHIAVTYALYKIFTPVRYTVTLGGTTWAIKLLTTRGLIKPRPMNEAKQNVQNIITAMKLPESERQKFLEEKGMPRIGKAVGQASAAKSTSTSQDNDPLKKQ